MDALFLSYLSYLINTLFRSSFTLKSSSVTSSLPTWSSNWTILVCIARHVRLSSFRETKTVGLKFWWKCSRCLKLRPSVRRLVGKPNFATNLQTKGFSSKHTQVFLVSFIFIPNWRPLFPKTIYNGPSHFTIQTRYANLVQFSMKSQESGRKLTAFGGKLLYRIRSLRTFKAMYFQDVQGWTRRQNDIRKWWKVTMIY